MGQSRTNALVLHPFGCTAWLTAAPDLRKKLDPKATRVVFTGYDLASKAFRFYDPSTRKIVLGRNAKFLDSDFSALRNNQSATECEDVPESVVLSSVEVQPQAVAKNWTPLSRAPPHRLPPYRSPRPQGRQSPLPPMTPTMSGTGLLSRRQQAIAKMTGRDAGLM
ncbi:BQ2448_3425 [Microbotryum intermedium]|uniref:BQ2448_3425 protein n=1 Tax=Microbotryum intermedium TaxID=269621 RepID=A0A238FF86_9BASI|nr:BQ2448_3425 [Microbotryum intermedium]